MRKILGLMAAAACTVLISCSATQELDRQLMGEPSPAVAMYAAQVRHAHGFCTAEGLVPDAKAGKRFLTMSGERGVALRHYTKHHPGFRADLRDALQKYVNAGARMTPAQKQRFCAAFARDAGRRATAVQLVQKSHDFREYFSPPDERVIKRQEAASVVLLAASAAGLAAGYQQTSNGEFFKAQNTFTASGALAGMAGNYPRVGNCGAYAPFTRHALPDGAAVWSHYHSLATCAPRGR